MTDTVLPEVVAGPLLRRFTNAQMTFWLITSRRCDFIVTVKNHSQNNNAYDNTLTDNVLRPIQVGDHAYVYLLELPLTPFLLDGDQLSYCIATQPVGGEPSTITQQMPWLLYENEAEVEVVFKANIDSVLHGSCRKPHHTGIDALAEADSRIGGLALAQRPALLMMSGDQIYADDVAGPLLCAIHQTIDLLGLWPEQLTGSLVEDSEQLFKSDHCYYAREQLLPDNREGNALAEGLFNMVRKPIFTSDSAHNHLITLSEVIAMYVLVWSPVMWPLLSLNIDNVTDEHFDRYQQEQRAIRDFVKTLPNVQRLLAHIPSYMMFDDHDVTDDWNLSRGWEETAYNHPFSRRILGNALLGYWLCQGWGNAPERFESSFIEPIRHFFNERTDKLHSLVVDNVLEFNRWHYTVATTPKMVVLDTRTQRWRSESSADRPSGLMDWESLSELQNDLLGEEAVILVSPAPIFGVKLIESIQRLFTLCGKALMVDAENWMAHPGSANVLLNIFQHPKTPQNFVILSGDVHYSFAYDVTLRTAKVSPSIWQITCSGFKNEFPPKLLMLFDRVNTALFGSKSPLNIFTKRRKMKIKARKPDVSTNQRLIVGNSIGLLVLDKVGKPSEISIWLADGETITFNDKAD